MNEKNNSELDIAKRTADIAELFIKNTGKTFATPQEYIEFLNSIRMSLTGSMPEEKIEEPAPRSSATFPWLDELGHAPTTQLGSAEMLKRIRTKFNIPQTEEPFPFKQLPLHEADQDPFAVGFLKVPGRQYKNQRDAIKDGPIVPVEMSVFDSKIICLEDGVAGKTLKRHLRLSFGMTLEEYIRKWRLPKDYLLIAPAYSRHRTKLAELQWEDASKARGKPNYN